MKTRSEQLLKELERHAQECPRTFPKTMLQSSVAGFNEDINQKSIQDLQSTQIAGIVKPYNDVLTDVLPRSWSE